jgi:hypothetical protein
MHCELIVPGLFSERAGTRVPALELLLARGRAATGASHSLETWLQEAFGLETQPFAAGALTLLAENDDPGEACWARADPVHLRLMRDRLIVAPSAAFPLSSEEAAALVDSLNAHFGDALFLKAVAADRWCARLAGDFAFTACAPIEAAGRDVDVTQRIGGEAGKGWGKLLNEVQMLLHAHPVNLAREGRGDAAVNSLWLWGVGRLPRAAPSRWQSVTAADPVALGLGRLAGARPRPLPASARAWLEQSPPDGCHLVVLDGLRAPLALAQTAAYRESLEALEENWFAPLLAALRAGRVGMVTVAVPETGGASFETIRGDLRRFWRRRKGLEAYA